ncbi:MAG: mechanosensitive ion channel family protein [Deltaproteobacteria bacterium]|nr:mechanosensitive ion channel family protein [Deltaproteobacteria bacterium]
MEETLKGLVPLLLDYGVRVIGVLLGLWIAFRLARWVETRIIKGLEKRNFDQALTLFFGSIVRWVLIIAAVLACLSVFGIETTSFAAILGAAGLAVGLAFQGTLGNFSAGVMLLTFRPFKIGDLIKVADQLGVVAEIGLFTTSIDTLDHRRVIIPNGTVIGGTIENLTHNAKRRVDIDVGVDYGEDLDKVRELLEAAAAGIPGRDSEEGHQVILLKLNDSSIDWQVRVWCSTDDYWDVWDATVLAIKKALDKGGISIPFPQMDVHLDKTA